MWFIFQQMNHSLKAAPVTAQEPFADSRVNHQNRFLQFKTWSSKLTFSGNHSLPCLHPSGSSDPLNKPKGMEKSHEITHCSQRSLWNNVLNFCRGKSGERGRFSHVSSFSQPNLQRHWPSWPLLPSPAEAAKTQCIWNSTEIKCQVP